MQIYVREKVHTVISLASFHLSHTPVMTVNVLKQAASLPDDWIPDDDFYNIQMRARKLLTATGVASSVSQSTSPATGESHLSSTAGGQLNDKALAPHLVLTVKQEPVDSEPQTSAPPFHRRLTATKRRLKNQPNEDRCDRQSSKRGKFSPGHDVQIHPFFISTSGR